MIYGLYLSAQGAELQSARLDVTANNLANASTTAFKRDLAIFQAHRPRDVERGNSETLPNGLNESTGGVSVAGVFTNFADGPLQETEAALDVALRGPGFFRVRDGQQDFLTRNGNFATNKSGELVLADTGHRVLSKKGRPIVVPTNTKTVEFGEDGSVAAIDYRNRRAAMDHLDIVQPRDLSSLRKLGDGLYDNQSGVLPAGNKARVIQGFLEGSGVQPVTEMMEMIEGSRTFEANVNMIRYQDESLGMLLQSSMRR